MVDVVTTDGYLVRMKPLIITQQRANLGRQDIRTRTRDIIIAFCAKNTFSDLQRALLDGKLEEEIEKGVKSIYPVRSVAVRKSQLLQEGVVASDGRAHEIHAEEQRQAAELKAKKAAALAAAMAEEEGEMADDDSEEADDADAEVEARPMSPRLQKKQLLLMKMHRMTVQTTTA